MIGGVRSSFLLLALMGCAADPPMPHEATLAPDVRMVVPEPAALGRSVSAVQMVVARHGDERFAFHARIDVSPEGLDLVVLDPFGARAITLSWRDGELSYRGERQVPAALSPADLLAALAIIYWPLDAVRAGLAPSGASLVSGRGRSVVVQGREVVSVEYEGPEARSWSGVARYRNLALGLELDVHSVLAPE